MRTLAELDAAIQEQRTYIAMIVASHMRYDGQLIRARLDELLEERQALA